MKNKPDQKLETVRFFRFLLSGVANTLITLTIFLILASALHESIAYSMAYIIGVLFAYLINAKFVFVVNYSWRTFFRFPIIYVLQYLYGLMLLLILTSQFQVAHQLAILVVVGTSVPLTYALSRFLFKKTSGSSRSDAENIGRKY